MKKYFCIFGKRGSISILVLVFGFMISVAVGGLVMVAATQYTASTRTESYERALTIAEAGIDYYRWHLTHAPNDYTDGTGHAGPYNHTISDPYGNTEGTFSLSVSPSSTGSAFVTISSTGWLNSHPDIKRTVKTKYGRPSMAKYTFLQNGNMWYGTRTTVHGKIFSNGGIRMDGTNDSAVQSAKATYTCGVETGCDPSVAKPGVWGDGGPQSLWQFPVSPVDFVSVAVDFTTMKASAVQNGTYFGPSGSFGYHLTFLANGTVTVKKVTATNSKKGWSLEDGCQDMNEEIKTESNVGTYSTSNRPVIFAEDNLWVEGVINGRVTVVAAKFPIDVNKMNIWIDDSLTYLAKDGASRLGLIAQNDIYFALDVPQDTEVDAAMLAQSGKIIRHNYKFQGCSHLPEAVRQSLTVYGSIISNSKAYWTFGNGPNIGYGTDPTAGFKVVTITYDPNLYYDPPPSFPSQGDLELISWEEN